MESPSVAMWRFLTRESCHTESNAFCTSTVATNVSLGESLLFDNLGQVVIYFFSLWNKVNHLIAAMYNLTYVQICLQYFDNI